MTSMAVGSTELTNAEFRTVCGGKFFALIYGGGVSLTRVSGSGTSQLSVTRDSLTQWTVRLPSGSIGRLYERSGKNYSNKGLYYFSAEIVLTQR